MTFKEYHNYFKGIIDAPEGEKPAPYNDSEYFGYTNMNWVRSERWMKSGKLNEELIDVVKNIKTNQNWLLITEPWCGDAAHSVPFIAKIAELNPLINLNIELRDSEPFSIDKYLTNGGKSIPILVIRDENNKDIAIWGPRPKPCAELFKNLKDQNMNFDDLKTEIQKWYNADKGQNLQEEILALIS